MATDITYLNGIKDLDSVELSKALIGSIVRFSCVDFDEGTTKGYLSYSDLLSGCIWTTTNSNKCLFTIESSHDDIGSFVLKANNGSYIKNSGSMNLLETKSRGFVFDIRGVFGDLLAIGIRAEDNNSRIPDSGTGFTDEIIEYSTSTEGILSLTIHTAGEPLIEAICVGKFLTTANCLDFCTTNPDECNQRKKEYCSTKEGASTQTCQDIYAHNGLATRKLDNLFMRNAMIEKCFDDFKDSGLTQSDFINQSNCACFWSDAFYQNLAKSTGQDVTNARLLFPSCAESRFGAQSKTGSIVHVTGSGEATSSAAVTQTTSSPTTTKSSRKLRNLEILFPIILGFIILIAIVVWLVRKK